MCYNMHRKEVALPMTPPPSTEPALVSEPCYCQCHSKEWGARQNRVSCHHCAPAPAPGRPGVVVTNYRSGLPVDDQDWLTVCTIVAEMIAARAQREERIRELLKYAGHTKGCRLDCDETNPPCDCGWASVQDKARALLGEAPDDQA